MKFRGRAYENRNLYLRGRYWWVTYTNAKGKRKFENTGKTDLFEAQKIRDLRLIGIGPKGKQDSDLTIEQAIHLYLEERRELGRKIPAKLKRSLHDDERVLGRLQEFVGGERLLSTLDDSDFDGFEGWLIEKYPKATSIHRRNRHFKILNIFFNRCLRKRRMKFNPILPHLDELLPEEKRERFLKVAEYSTLLRVCSEPQNGFNPMLRPIVEVGAITGLRLNDVLMLSWQNIDFEAGEIRIIQMKTRKKHLIPIGTRLREILMSIQPDMDSPYVFCWQGKRVTKNGWFRTEWKKACRLAGLSDVRYHDLRRTHATHSQDDSPVDIIQRNLGHSSRSMTDRYIGGKVEPLKKAQEALTARLYDFGDGVLHKVLQSRSTVALLQRVRPSESNDNEVKATYAGVAELADALDSKSGGPCGRVGSTPIAGIHLR